MTDNQKNTLPKNWELKTLGEVCLLKNGYAFKSDDYKEAGIPMIRISDINDNEIQLKNTVKVLESEDYQRFFVEYGDILIAMSGATTGKFGIYKNKEKAYQNQRVGNFQITNKKLLDKDFLYFSLHSLKRKIEADAYGGAQPNISSKKIEELQIPLPPLPEQQKIVQKIESLFTELETGTKALKTALNQLKIYRQAVLNHFLTNDNWKTVKLGDVCDRIFDGPFGSNLKSSDYTSSGVQVVRLENIGFMEFFEDKETFVNEDKYQSLIKHEVFEGDIIFSSFIGDYIRTTILPNLKYKAIAKADCFCVRPKEKFIDKQFLTFVLSSIRTQKILVLAVHGATRPRINTTQLKSFSFPLPSLEIQTQIVAEIEKRMVAADALEASLKSQVINAENLRQSILKRAFEGKLV